MLYFRCLKTNNYTDLTTFTICYDSKYVGGTRENGKVEVGIGDCKNTQVFTCNVTDIVPEFCEDTTTTTLDPTTSEPTTNDPTTADPTTADPTTAPPTTAEPTTAEPTTAEPTTAQPTTRLTTPAIPEFIYVSHTELDYDAARRYCKRNYGTTLATISNALERQQARDLIGDQQVWFGLFTKDESQWRFLNKDACTNENTRFKCIDFWKFRKNKNTKYRPRCIGSEENGNQCSYFNGEDNMADNDIDCEMKLPFLCNKQTNS